MLNVPKPGCNSTPGSHSPCFPGGSQPVKNLTLSCTSSNYSEEVCDALGTTDPMHAKACGACTIVANDRRLFCSGLVSEVSYSRPGAVATEHAHTSSGDARPVDTVDAWYEARTTCAVVETQSNCLELTTTTQWPGAFDDDQANAAKYARAWRALNDPNGFDAAWGPRTAERRHPCYNFTRWSPIVGPDGCETNLP